MQIGPVLKQLLNVTGDFVPHGDPHGASAVGQVDILEVSPKYIFIFKIIKKEKLSFTIYL